MSDKEEVVVDPAEVAAHGDGFIDKIEAAAEENDPGDLDHKASEDGEDGEPVKAEEVKAEEKPEEKAEEEDDGEPKTPEELKAAYQSTKKALKAISGRLAAKAADNRRLVGELQKTIKPVADSEPVVENEDTPQRTDYKTKIEFDAAVKAAAQRLAEQQVAQQNFNAKCNEVEDRGSKAFGNKWGAAKAQLAILDDEGRIPFDLLETALETENPAKVLFELGQDIDRATQFMAMTPARRAIAMAKIAESKVVERPQSRTPPPVDPLGGKGARDDRPRDSDSDEEWNRKEELRERRLMEERRKKYGF